MQIAKIPAGGKVFFAVPYSSPISKFVWGPELVEPGSEAADGPDGLVDPGGKGGGVEEDGLDMVPS